MNFLSHLRLRTKLTLLVGLSAVAMVAIATAEAMTMHQRMLDARVEQLRAVVSSTVAIAKSLEASAAAQDITPPQAIERFHQDIHAIRFDGGVGYMSVLETRTGNVLIHGANPALEGKPLPADAATGQPISSLLLAAIRSADEGLASYVFPKPGQTEPLGKIVAVARFAPWDMAIFAGAYTDDVDAAFHASLRRTGAVGGTIMLLT